MGVKIGHRRQKLVNWPPLEEVENLRWANNHTQYKSITYGFCEAQDCCEICDSRMRILCKAKCWIEGIRLRIIKRHYGIKMGGEVGMTDREKVIRGLECCTTGDCEGCPYDGDGDLRGECIKRTQVDALEIINDLIRKDDERTADPTFDGRGWSCGACGEVLDEAMYRHCPGCGRRLVWIHEETEE